MNKFRAEYLAAFEFDVRTIVDIGVYRGTLQLYRAFPDAELILIDPLAEARVVAEKVARYRDVKFVEMGVGDREMAIDLHVPPGENRSGSSLLRRNVHIRRKRELIRREVAVRPLDKIMAEADLPPPYGVKIDTEGYERFVMAGAQETLRQTRFVIIEVTLQDLYGQRSLPSEIIADLAAVDFELFDVLNVDRKNNIYLDCIFLKKDDPRFQPGYSNDALVEAEADQTPA